MFFSTYITKLYARYVEEFTASLYGSLILWTPDSKEDMPEKSTAMIGSTNKIIAITLVFILSLFNATFALAQSSASNGSPDTRSPVIELEAVAESQAESYQVFTAQVVDDRLLKDVILYHRRDGQQAFSPIQMNLIGDSAFFTATIKTDPSDLRAIQYYVQARDEGGNRTVQGYAFDPYTRVLTTNDSVITTQAPTPTPTPTETVASSGEIKWWHVALGVVVVGALASAASGSDSGGTTDEGSVPLTVTVTGL